MPPELAGVLAIAGLILVKEAGIPIPVPGDLVVIGAGVSAGALAGVPMTVFMAGLAIGNTLFIAAHFGLGYLLGESVVTAVGGLLGPFAIGFVGLALIGGIGRYLIRRRRRVPEDPMATAMSWTDACCPACLALTVMDRSPA